LKSGSQNGNPGLWGESDKLVPPVYACAFQSAIPHAELILIPEARHMVAFEKIADVLTAIRRVFDERYVATTR
jgi:pimeloyl-ACP methyl ester carboxylesterase